MTTTTGDIFPKGKRRGPQSELRLHEAYRAVFTLQKPMKEDLDLVLADLGEFSGYHAVLSPTATDGEMRDHNGRRAVFARILSLIELPLSQLNDLRNAALVEMQISNEEGSR